MIYRIYRFAAYINIYVVQWDYGKEINITLEDALMSLESLRFMLGGAIKRPEASAPVIVRHTEEVVCGANGVVPKPKDHLTDIELTPKATYGHPIRLINLTKGTRTQLVVETAGGAAKEIDGEKAIDFVNPSMIGEKQQTSEQGDHIRIFWEEVVTGAADEKETAVEVTISPDTFSYRVEVYKDY